MYPKKTTYKYYVYRCHRQRIRQLRSYFCVIKSKRLYVFLFSNSFNLILAPHNHANHFERVRGEHSTSENDVSELDTFYVPEWGSSQSI